jgi:hypothetical protein
MATLFGFAEVDRPCRIIGKDRVAKSALDRWHCNQRRFSGHDETSLALRSAVIESSIRADSNNRRQNGILLPIRARDSKNCAAALELRYSLS